MAWYAAHIVLFFRRKRKRQAPFLLWENIVLLKAESEDEAFARAEERGRQDASATRGNLRLDEEPAELVFGGVRKLVLCQDEDHRPKDGTEVSYIELEVRSEEALHKWIAGEAISATIVDTFADEVSATTKPKDHSAGGNGATKR